MNYKLLKINRISYKDSVLLQKILENKVLNDNREQYILALSHNDVITTGKRGFLDTLKYDESFYFDKKIELIKTDRGGLATYHGKGQLVLYFIVNLFDLKLGIKEFIDKIEDSIIEVLKNYNIDAGKISGFRGVFVDANKIAAVGMHVKHNVTTHGIALNIFTNLDNFNLFIPCGLKNKGVTSIKKELNKDVDFDEVLDMLIDSVSKNLGVKIERR